MEGAANILVVESDSECLELRAISVAQEYDKRAFASDDRRLRRLSGIMLVNKGWATCGPNPSNVEFCQTQYAAVPLNERLATALKSISLGVGSNGDFRVIFAKKTSVSVFAGDLRRKNHTPGCSVHCPWHEQQSVGPSLHARIGNSRVYAYPVLTAANSHYRSIARLDLVYPSWQGLPTCSISHALRMGYHT